jgi:hypothetical protein
VEREHAEQLAEDDDRHREHRARAEGAQRLDSAERRVIELGRCLDVPNHERLALPAGEVGDRQRAARRHGLELRHVPLRCELVLRRAVANEAPVDADCLARLLDGDREHLVDVQLGAHLPRDPGDDALSLERLRQCRGRAGAVERGRGLAGDLVQ